MLSLNCIYVKEPFPVRPTEKRKFVSNQREDEDQAMFETNVEMQQATTQKDNIGQNISNKRRCSRCNNIGHTARSRTCPLSQNHCGSVISEEETMQMPSVNLYF
jgi:hypothetical protein